MFRQFQDAEIDRLKALKDFYEMKIPDGAALDLHETFLIELEAIKRQINDILCL